MKDKVVLITGASEGIGKETALQFAKEGCKLVITYNSHKKEAESVAKECKKLGSPEVLVYKLDITIDKDVIDLIKKVDKISILINNAGVLTIKPLVEQTFKQIEYQVRANLEGLMKLTSLALPKVTDMVINIASEAGKTAYATLTPYCATKFGLRGFTQGLAQETKIPIITVNPGMTSTKMTNFVGVPAVKVAEIILNTAKGKYKTKSGGDVDVEDIL